MKRLASNLAPFSCQKHFVTPNMTNTYEFTSCQKQAFDLLENTPENIFLTGCAGSGKSFLIKEFLKGKDRKTFPVLASTGAAAVLIGGRTFHSFFGLGIMRGNLEDIVQKALDNRQVVRRLRQINGFVLDEVSMIPANALKAAEMICARARRKPNLPWGGARVIVVGDFAQLPPISERGADKPWAFLSEAWRKSCFVPVVLKTLVRSNDQEFLEILNEVRNGQVSELVSEYLNARTFDDVQDTRDVPHFFPFRRQSEALNSKRLREIDDELYEFRTEFSGNPRAIESLKKNLFLQDVLQIKKSAFVMIRVNDPKYKYVNGSLGHVLEIEEAKDKTVLHIELLNGKVVEIERMGFSILSADGEPLATANNFPVTLAYATTIHKSQGVTVDRMVVDLRNLWEPGQAYVALSRLRTGDGLHLTGWDSNSFKVSPDVVQFYQTLEV